MIAIADSWEGRDGSSFVSVSVSGFETEDKIVVISFAFGGSGSPTTPIDDGSNVYTVRTQTTPDGTYDAVVAIADAIVDTPPTSVEVQNSAGGANDIGIVVLRVTHDGSAWTSPSYVTAGTVTGTGPTTDPITVGATTPTPFANNGSALYLAALTHDGATTTFTAGTGWATVEEDEDASGVPYSVVSKVETSSGPQTHQWSVGASRDYAWVIAAYTEAVPDPVLSLVATAPSPPVSGLGLQVTEPYSFPDPDLKTFHILTHPAGDGLVVPTIANAELLRVTAWDVLTLPPVDWTIEREEGGTQAQNIEAGWWVWWDHTFSDPVALMEYIAAIQLEAVAGGIDGVVDDIEDIEDDIDNVEGDIDAVESDVDAIEAKLALVNRTVYTSGAGTHTFDTDCVTVSILVCGGGGGGGAAIAAVGEAAAGSGGGGGGVAQSYVSRAGATDCDYEVGAGGAGGTTGGVLAARGDDSVVTLNSVDYLGEGGLAGVSISGGTTPSGRDGPLGGDAQNGDMNSTGQPGGDTVRLDATTVWGGTGGSSVMGGGGGSGVRIGSGALLGSAGGNYGGGGGGGVAIANSRAGGAGGGGIVIIEEFGIGV